MADSNKVDINFSAETNKASGDVKKFKGEIEAVGPSGKKAAASISGSFKTIESSISKVRKAISMVSFGTMWISAVTDIIGKFRAWREEVRKTAVEAQKLKNEAKFDEQTHGVDALINRYKDLTKSIQEASKTAQDAERQASAATDAARSKEDADLQLREEQEVAALDRNDPAYGEKVRQIRQRFSGARNLLGAQRAAEDAEARRKAYSNEAWDEDVNAATYANNAKSARANAGEMRRQAELWKRLAEYGKTKSGEGWIDKLAGTAESDRMLADFFKAGGDQSFMSAIKGMTPEEIAEYAKEQAARFGEKASKAEETAASFESKSADSAAKSKTAAALAESQSGMVAAARTKRQATGIAAQTAQGDADASLSKAEETARQRAEEERRTENEKREKAAAEEAARASALAAVPQLSAERDRIRAQIAAEEERKAAAGMAVYQAQGAYDAAKLGGNRGAQQTAFSGLQSAQNAAQDVNHAADSAINALTETLKNIEERLRAAQNYLKKQSGQQGYAWSESPAGA